MQEAPEGYEPHYFRVQSGAKPPELRYGSWKDESARMGVDEATAWMNAGGNVGIAGTSDDCLVNIDIDDEDETSIDDLEPTLIARSRSRTGFHAWYFSAEPGAVPNIPTDSAGEVRADWQYVVAPGSYVKTDPDSVPDDQRDDAGYYTIEHENPVASIGFDGLPKVFRETYERNQRIAAEAEENREEREFDPTATDGDQSALFNIDAKDVVRQEGGDLRVDKRWTSLFHGSETDANMALSSEGLLHCFRHNVAHNGLQSLVVLSDYIPNGDRACERVGTAHSNSGGSPSCISGDDSAIWHAWKYAKLNDYVPEDDPVPYRAIKHLCREMGVVSESEIPDDYDPEEGNRLPAYAYNSAISAIENRHGIDPGRETVSLSSQRTIPDKKATSAVEEIQRADGGTAVESAQDGGQKSSDYSSIEERIGEEVLRPLEADADDEASIDIKTATHRAAHIFWDEYHFVYPERGVTGWRNTLYVYSDRKGIYEPRGEEFVSRSAERMLGPIATNQRINELVRKIERMSLSGGEEFSNRPERLVVGNGILNLHKGILERHSPEEYHKTRIGIDYDPEAECPAIDEWFHEVVEDRDVPTLYQIAAHCLYREYLAEKAIMLVGSGQNGKSIYTWILEELLNPSRREQNVSGISLQSMSDDQFAVNQLHEKLANINSDINASMVDNLGPFKQLTGRDRIMADVKYEQPVTFENYATLIFAVNQMPSFDEDTHALWRRWVYLKFPYTFKPEDDETVSKRALKRRLGSDVELEGLLARCVEEIEAWHQGRELFTNIPGPNKVREMMLRAAEPVYDFAMVCLREDEEGWLTKDEVRNAFRAYATETGMSSTIAMKPNKFGEKLLNITDYHIESSRRQMGGERHNGYEGIDFSPRGRELLGKDGEATRDGTLDLRDTNSSRAAIKGGPPDDAVGNEANGKRVLITLRDIGESVSRGELFQKVAAEYDISPDEAEKGLEYILRRGDAMEVDGGEVEST